MTLSARPRASTFRRGFTIVELLVVISIIAILIALVSVGLSQAGKSARQTQFLSNLKQIGTAWTQYANQNDEKPMYGYVDDGVQDAFRIRAKDQAGNNLPQEFVRTYPFRLLPFLNNDRSLMYDYLPDYEDLGNIPNDVIANNPAFGYNANYVGGWWTTQAGAPKMRFSNTGYFRSPGNLVPRLEVVVRSLGQVQRPSELIIFASSVSADVGFIKSSNENIPGSAWVVPHRMGQTDYWVSGEGGFYEGISVPGSAPLSASLEGGMASIARAVFAPSQAVPVQGDTGINVLVAESVPLRRIKNVVQTLRVDLSTTAQGVRDLMDQRKWINVAGDCSDPVNFSHPE
ncbi:MAG: type II secretion system protein [Planctomycetota bacterium]